MNLISYSATNSKKKIFILSIPVFFSNLAVPLSGIIDTGLMGNLGETKFLAATSIAVSIMTMIIWSFGFLRMGTVGIVAQLLAKSDYREIVRTLLRSLIIAIVLALVVILFKPILINLTKNFFSTSIETQELIKTYIAVRLFSIPAEFTIYILVGFYLGIQKTNISSLLIVVLSILNIVFSSFFVLSLNLDVFGVALGTLIANYITAIIFILFTYNFIVKKFHIIFISLGYLLRFKIR
jgi:MATE family multidrug resistance protein